MDHWLQNDSALWRLMLWLGTLLVLLALEQLLPRRSDPPKRSKRWLTNIGLVILSTLLAALLPLTALGTAYWAQHQHWGGLNRVDWPLWLRVGLGWLLLDAAIYWQHRLMHRIPLLWRLHRVHHSDLFFDTTTALRFHPLEILLSVLFKCGVILLLGAPPSAVFIFELLLSCVALFNHSNLRLPGDHWLRCLIVTPDQHRIHHSAYRAETDSNYANVLSLWDHLFHSYTAQPLGGQGGMQIGLYEFRGDNEQTLPALLVQPQQNPHRL